MNTEKPIMGKEGPIHFVSTDKLKLDLITKIIEKAWEAPAGDSTSWAGFMEGTLFAIEAVARFGEGDIE